MGKWRKEKPRDPGAWGEERRWQTTLCKAPGGRPFSLGREDSVVHPSKAGIPPRRSRHSAKVVSWYIITFISKLCMKKNEKQQNFHLSSRVHPPILLPEDFAYIPCTPEDSFSQGLRPQEYLFCTQIKATSTLNNLWLNSFFCLRGDFKIICVRVEWQTCSRVLRAWNLSVQHDKPQPWLMSLAIYSMVHVLYH